MPIYYFPIHDDHGVIPDEEGMTLDNDSQAKHEGEMSAREMLAHDLRFRLMSGNRRVQVVNSEGSILASYGVRDIISN